MESPSEHAAAKRLKAEVMSRLLAADITMGLLTTYPSSGKSVVDSMIKGASAIADAIIAEASKR